MTLHEKCFAKTYMDLRNIFQICISVLGTKHNNGYPSIHVVCRSACRSDARALNTCMDKTPASTVRNSRGLNLEDAKFANRGSRDSLSTGYSRDAVHRYPAQGAQSHYGRKLKLNKLCLHQTALLRLSFPPRGPENLKIHNN